MKKITLITGAGRGIGKEIALKFGKETHSLILLVFKKKQKEELRNILQKKKIDFKIIVGDLRNAKFINSLNKKIDRIDNLVNNAAMANSKYFTDVSETDLNDLIEVNLKAPYKLTQICARKMIKYKIKGCIISITSQLGHIGAFNRSAYCMSKFGLEGLNKAVAMDLSKYGIRSIAVAPTKTIVNQEERVQSKKRLNLIKNKIPLRRFSTTKEIAEIVYFLTTSISSSITGSSILSDGGWTAGR
jgi:NAD(P)-dependent dehydrogenase (short-subunit alcohol dehydrogenase family)